MNLRVVDETREKPPLVENRTGVRGRNEILSPLTNRERMLVCAIVETLRRARNGSEKYIGAPDSDMQYLPQFMVGLFDPLLTAFSDATGVDYLESGWDE